MAEDKHSKKHPASDHKKKQLKKKGTVAKSQDVPMAAGLLAAFGIMVALRNFYLDTFHETMRYCIEQIQYTDDIDLGQLLIYVMVKVAMLSLPIMAAIMVIGIATNMAQSGLIFTGEQLKPNLKKINPMNKLKQWFSMKSLQELAKSLAKILAAGLLGFYVWKGALAGINDAVWLDAAGLLALGATIIKKMFLQIVLLYVVVAAIDFMFQRKNFATEHKMSDKEVKDEYKQMEGDPYMKAKRRQVAQQIASQQSQDHVPESNAVIINPTELAIAIKYDPEISPVPYVVSKGEQRHADDIRSSARGAGVPVVRNKPLARALYDMCEIGDLVPEELYRPVAEVLAYVFALQEQAQADAQEAAALAATQAWQGDPHSAANANAPGHHAVSATHAIPAAEEQVHELGAIAVPTGLPVATAEGASAAHAGSGQLLDPTWSPIAVPAATAVPFHAAAPMATPASGIASPWHLPPVADPALHSQPPYGVAAMGAGDTANGAPAWGSGQPQPFANHPVYNPGLSSYSGFVAPWEGAAGSPHDPPPQQAR